MYASGGRRIGVTSLPPLGCFPAARTLFGSRHNGNGGGDGGCVSHINANAKEFNRKLNSAAFQLRKELPGLKIVIFDIYKVLYDIIKSPSNYGTYNHQSYQILKYVIIYMFFIDGYIYIYMLKVLRKQGEVVVVPGL